MATTATAAASDRSLSDTPRATIAGILLLFASCLPLLGATLLIPNLANIARQFPDTENLTLMISLVATAPGVMIGVLAPFVGTISDKLGRKRLLLAAAAAYSLVGIAPVFLDTLPAIVLSRVLLGVCEAIIMTVCTALIADYFEGPRRVKYLSLQTVFTSVSAVAFVLLGGLAARYDWRAPFWFYTLGIMLAVPLAVFVWEPATRLRSTEDDHSPTSGVAPVVKSGTLWRHLALPLAFTLFTGIACNAVNINASFLFPARGYSQDPGAIGMLTAVLQVGTAISALSFGWLVRFGSWRVLPMGYVLQAVGFLLVAFVDSLPIAVFGSLIVHFGFGIQLPALITWALSGTRDVGAQGRSSGLWTSAFWIGQLLFSFVYAGLVGVLGNQFSTVGVFGAATAMVAAIAFLFVPRMATLFSGTSKAPVSHAGHGGPDGWSP